MKLLMLASAMAVSTPALAKWETWSAKDPLQNNPGFYAALKADRTIIAPSRRPEIRTKEGVLLVTCNPKNELNVLFGVVGELVSSRRTRVEYRFDADDAKETQFTGSETHDYGGLWRIRGNHPFLLRLQKSNALLIRLTEPVWGSVEFHFTTLGASEALTPEKLPCMKRR